jgi:hypothetical protein
MAPGIKRLHEPPRIVAWPFAKGEFGGDDD